MTYLWRFGALSISGIFNICNIQQLRVLKTQQNEQLNYLLNQIAFVAKTNLRQGQHVRPPSCLQPCYLHLWLQPLFVLVEEVYV